MKKCPKCKSEMFESMEPKVSTLANQNSILPAQAKYLRCTNCGFREKI